MKFHHGRRHDRRRADHATYDKRRIQPFLWHINDDCLRYIRRLRIDLHEVTNVNHWNLLVGKFQRPDARGIINPCIVISLGGKFHDGFDDSIFHAEGMLANGKNQNLNRLDGL
jgi:hypothetical protein